MKRSIFLHLGDVLRDYPRIDNAIEEHLQCDYYTVTDDRAIQRLREEQRAIDECVADSTEMTINVIGALYFERDRSLTNDGVALSLHLSKATLYRCRNEFLERLRNKLGW